MIAQLGQRQAQKFHWAWPKGLDRCDMGRGGWSNEEGGAYKCHKISSTRLALKAKPEACGIKINCTIHAYTPTHTHTHTHKHTPFGTQVTKMWHTPNKEGDPRT